MALMLGIILFPVAFSTTEAQTPDREIGGLTLRSDSPGTLQVSWDEVSPKPSDHRVNWAKSSEGYPSWREADGNAYPETNSYTITGLDEGVEYKVHVRARYSGESPGPWSETVTATVAVTALPPNAPGQDQGDASVRAPSNLAAEVDSCGVSLSWDAPSEDAGSVTGYRLLRDQDGEETSILDTASTSTSYTDNAVSRGETYGYKVKALRADTASGDSNMVEVAVPTAPTPTTVEIEEVPIVVTSTTADYFVLYVQHDLDAGATVDIPVLAALGEDGTTTLAENVAAQPKERYRVEKYQVSHPADVDGDCIDDITELANPTGMSPIVKHLGATIPLTAGALVIPDRETFETLGRGEADPWVNFVLVDIDTDSPRLYFSNSNTYNTHGALFLDDVGIEWEGEELVSGSRLVRGRITYRPLLDAPDGSSGVYEYRLTLHDYSFSLAALSYTVLASGMPLIEGNLALYLPDHMLPLNESELLAYGKSRMNVVFTEDFQGTTLVALNPGEGYGLLRLMEPGERPNPRDIVVYDVLPNELPRVAGIVTTVPQTRLSHVNLRAIQDGVPNAFIEGALGDPLVETLLGKFVRYEVTGSEWNLREATKAEVDAHYAASRPVATQTPQRDLTVTGITALGDIEFDDWTAFGVKAANVAELGTLGFTDGTVPDGFAVPFYFYDEFMKANGFYTDVAEMLADPEFQTDHDTQEDELKKLRKKIKNGTTPAWIITALEEMHATFPEGTSLRYRSSTNNEDLPGFSGAGLYDSKTQDPDETIEDGIDKSIKGVWASLWNFRAFVERDFHRVDHLTTAMGVLVHPNYSDERANGVAVSADPVYGGAGRYYVNTQLGEDLVTNPEASSVPEEILLNESGSYIVLATSNQVPPGQLLMSDVQIAQLHQHLGVIHDHFKGLYEPEDGEEFAIEIEFKITSDNVLAIKQARPWVFNDANQPATGTPTITGTAEIGRTLNADTSGIHDADGVASAAFYYQWTRAANGTDSDITGATGAEYTVTEADAGSSLRVRVTFTDDEGHNEELTSEEITVNAPFWSATLIVGEDTGTAPAINGYSRWSRLGEISPSYSFELESKRHRVMFLYHQGEALSLGISPQLDREFSLTVGDFRYVASESLVATSRAASTFWWPAPDLIWAAGEELPVRLTLINSPDASLEDRSAAPPTAYISNAPEGHDGVNPFTFRVYFSADYSLAGGGLQVGSFTVAGGEISSTEQVTEGTNKVWNVLAAPTSGEDVVVTLPAATDCALQGAICTSDGSKLYNRSELTVPLYGHINLPATGAPVINGTAQVGHTLTADTSGISDANGLTNASYSYQWIQNDGADDSDIAGNTAGTYTLVEADEGKTFKVRVTFSDDAGHRESLTSAATDAVVLPTSAPGQPTGLAADATSEHVTLTWDDPDDASITRYLVYRKYPNNPWEGARHFILVGIVELADYPFVDHEVEPGQRLFYQVQAENAVGKSVRSTSVGVTIPLPADSTTAALDPPGPRPIRPRERPQPATAVLD